MSYCNKTDIHNAFATDESTTMNAFRIVLLSGCRLTERNEWHGNAHYELVVDYPRSVDENLPGFAD